MSELVKVLQGLTLDGYGIFYDPRGQRWRLSLPIRDEDISRGVSIVGKREQIASALAAPDPRQSAAESLAAALREMLEFYNRPFSKTTRFEAGNNARAALAQWDKLK